MKRFIAVAAIVVSLFVAYYVGADQESQRTDLKSAWSMVQKEKGVLMYPDENHPFFSFHINPGIESNAQIIRVGQDHVVIRRMYNVSAYYQFTIPFGQIYLRQER